MPVSLSRILALILAAAGIGLALWLVPPLRAAPRRAAAVLALLAVGAAICLAAAGAPRFTARTWVRCVAVAAGGLTCMLVYALRYSVALDTLPSVPLSDTTLRSELADWCNALDAVAIAAAYLTAAFLVVPGPLMTTSVTAPGQALAAGEMALTERSAAADLDSPFRAPASRGGANPPSASSRNSATE